VGEEFSRLADANLGLAASNISFQARTSCMTLRIRRFPIPVLLVLRIVGADEYMELSIR